MSTPKITSEFQLLVTTEVEKPFNLLEWAPAVRKYAAEQAGVSVDDVDLGWVPLCERVTNEQAHMLKQYRDLPIESQQLLHMLAGHLLRAKAEAGGAK